MKLKSQWPFVFVLALTCGCHISANNALYCPSAENGKAEAINSSCFQVPANELKALSEELRSSSRAKKKDSPLQLDFLPGILHVTSSNNVSTNCRVSAVGLLCDKRNSIKLKSKTSPAFDSIYHKLQFFSRLNPRRADPLSCDELEDNRLSRYDSLMSSILRDMEYYSAVACNSIHHENSAIKNDETIPTDIPGVVLLKTSMCCMPSAPPEPFDTIVKKMETQILRFSSLHRDIEEDIGAILSTCDSHKSSALHQKYERKLRDNLNAYESVLNSMIERMKEDQPCDTALNNSGIYEEIQVASEYIKQLRSIDHNQRFGSH